MSSEVVISPIRNISAATEAQSLINIVDNAKRTGVYYRYSGTTQTVTYYDNNVTSSGTTTFTNNAYYLPTVNNVGFIVWTRQNNLGNAITGSFSDGNGSLDAILGLANETLGTPNMLLYYGMYYGYAGATLTTSSGNTYEQYGIYRLLINSEGRFYFEHKDTQKLGLKFNYFTVISAIKGQNGLMYVAREATAEDEGVIYYYNGGGDFYHQGNTFYILAYGETGEYMFRTFGTVHYTTASNGNLNLANKRIYVGNEYLGTGGTYEVIISATVYVNGEEYVRKFLVTVIG